MPKEKKKVVNLTEHKAKALCGELDKLRERQDAEALTGEALDEGIRLAIKDGGINLFSLAKTVMAQAEVLDQLEYKLALLSIYIVSEGKEKELEKQNLDQFMEDEVEKDGGVGT